MLSHAVLETWSTLILSLDQVLQKEIMKLEIITDLEEFDTFNHPEKVLNLTPLILPISHDS